MVSSHLVEYGGDFVLSLSSGSYINSLVGVISSLWALCLVVFSHNLQSFLKDLADSYDYPQTIVRSKMHL